MKIKITKKEKVQKLARGLANISHVLIECGIGHVNLGKLAESLLKQGKITSTALKQTIGEE